MTAEESADEQAHDHHSDVSGGRLRPAVFGAMDGLVTNIALIAGVSGGGVTGGAVMLTGVAGAVAGAISMAFGEFISVRAQNEQVTLEVRRERREIMLHPVAEEAELAAAWRRRGLSAQVADAVAAELHQRPEEALRAHAQEELGVDPGEQPSPWTAAVLSFVTFAVGALAPLITYFVGFDQLWPSLSVGAAGLFGLGAAVSRWTCLSWWYSGLRQLGLGAAAAGVTYLIGTAMGATGL